MFKLILILFLPLSVIGSSFTKSYNYNEVFSLTEVFQTNMRNSSNIETGISTNSSIFILADLNEYQRAKILSANGGAAKINSPVGMPPAYQSSGTPYVSVSGSFGWNERIRIRRPNGNIESYISVDNEAIYYDLEN